MVIIQIKIENKSIEIYIKLIFQLHFPYTEHLDRKRA